MTTPPNPKRRRPTQSISIPSSPFPPLPPPPPPPLLPSTTTTTSSSSSSSPPSSDPSVDGLFLSLCASHPSGMRVEQFTSLHPSIPLTSLILTINSLLSRGRLTVLSDASTSPPTPYYRTLPPLPPHPSSSSSTPSTPSPNPLDPSRLTSLSPPDLILYQMIAHTTNRGIWIRDLRRRSNLTSQEVTRALKTLMARRLVKAERSVEGKNKKVYMLYELEPAKEVKGNSWYGGGEFDGEFIAALRETTVAYVRGASGGSGGEGGGEGGGRGVSEVWEYLRGTGVFEVECTVEEVEMILNTLVFDGFLTCNGVEAGGGDDRDRVGGAKKLYRAQRGGVYEAEVVHVPCVVCPVRRQCSEEPGSVVSPYTCQYYTQWIDF